VPSRRPPGKRPARRLLGAIVPVPSAKKTQDRQRRPWLVSFGEGGALFSTRAGTSLSEGGCSDLDPFRGSGCGAKLTCSRLVRLAKTVRFPGPLIAAVHCHSPSSRTRRERSRLERASPAALQPTSPRHKRLKSSSVGSLKPAERDNPADVRSKALRRARGEWTKTACNRPREKISKDRKTGSMRPVSSASHRGLCVGISSAPRSVDISGGYSRSTRGDRAGLGEPHGDDHEWQRANS
jgi:hypothetical protein